MMLMVIMVSMTAANKLYVFDTVFYLTPFDLVVIILGYLMLVGVVSFWAGYGIQYVCYKFVNWRRQNDIRQ